MYWVMTLIAQARKHGKFLDFTNDRDKIKSIIVLINGTLCATSLTRDKINKILENKRNAKTRRSKNNLVIPVDHTQL